MQAADAILLEAFHAAGWTASARPFRCGAPGVNILALKEGTHSRDIWLVGAHHDTVDDSPGANDNTASVASLIELARRLAPHSLRDTVALAAFDMEETGFCGSRALVSELQAERRIRAGIVFETMAYTTREPRSQAVPPGIGLLYKKQIARIRRGEYRGDFTAIIHRRDSRSLAQSFAAALDKQAGSETALLLEDPAQIPCIGKLLERWVPAVRNFQRSDHSSLWDAGIPALMVTDTAEFRYPHYHKPADTPEKLDYDRLAAIVEATVAVLTEEAGLKPA
jgi:Zn-dependent M28 family amino/carboxypeptidase